MLYKVIGSDGKVMYEDSHFNNVRTFIHGKFEGVFPVSVSVYIDGVLRDTHSLSGI